MKICGKKCFVFDMDGTVYMGGKPISGTVDFIRRNMECIDIRFVTNNTSKSPEEYVGKLRSVGIEAPYECILTPIYPLAEHLKRNGLLRVYLVGNESFRSNLAELVPEVCFTEEDCDAVVVAYDTELTYEKLKKSCWLLQDESVEFLATHPDRVCPSERGDMPDVGSFLALYEMTVGRTPDAVFGKPNPAVLGPLATMYSPDEMVMVGDRIYTDMELARRCGMEFILVLSGESTEKDLNGLGTQPDFVMQDLEGLVLENSNCLQRKSRAQ